MPDNPELRTLLFSTEQSTADWAGTGDWFKRRGGARFSAPENVTLLEGKACTHDASLAALSKHSYSLTCVALHSDETGHAMDDGDLMAEEIAALETGSLITISHGCFAANWTKTERDRSGPNCGLSWVFGKHLGQAVVGHPGGAAVRGKLEAGRLAAPRAACRPTATWRPRACRSAFLRP